MLNQVQHQSIPQPKLFDIQHRPNCKIETPRQSGLSVCVVVNAIMLSMLHQLLSGHDTLSAFFSVVLHACKTDGALESV